MIKRLLLFLVFGTSANAQISGVVIDNVTHSPVSYANIYIDDKRWISSDEDGAFTIEAKPEEILTFTAVGYEEVKVKASDAIRVNLRPTTYKLETVTVVKPLMTIEKEFGGYKHKDVEMYYTTSGISQLLGRYFPPSESYAKTPFFKTLYVATKSSVKNAKFNIHILEVGEDGKPGRDLASENIIGIAKKGKNDTKIDLSPYHIKVPENGFFIAYEFLGVPENGSKEESYTDKSGVYHERINYAPYLGTVRTEGDTTTSWGKHSGLQWSIFKKVTEDRVQKYYDDFKKATGKDAPPFDYRFSEFAMKLIMTN